MEQKKNIKKSKLVEIFVSNKTCFAMKNVFYVLLFSIAIACSDSPKQKLEDSEQRIQLRYITWSCECANWATLEDCKKYEEDDSLAERCIYIEPTNKSLRLPDTIGYNGDEIELIGKFYKAKGFPKGYKKAQPPEEASVFQYSSYKILKSNYRASMNESSEK